MKERKREIWQMADGERFELRVRVMYHSYKKKEKRVQSTRDKRHTATGEQTNVCTNTDRENSLKRVHQ